MRWKLAVPLAICLFFISTSYASAQVVINEFSPGGSDDWIELYSPVDTDISGWILQDSTSPIKSPIPANTKIGPSTNKFFVFDASNRLNNSGDTIKLLKPNDSNPVSEITYGGNGNVCLPNTATQSIGRVVTVAGQDGGNTIERFETQTKGSTNYGAQLASCPSPTPEATNTPMPTDTPTNAPTATKTPSPKPSSTKTPTLSPTESLEETETPSPAETNEVLGAETSVTGTPVLTPTPSAKGSPSKIPLLACVFIGGGIVTIGTSLFLFLRSRKGYTKY